MTGWALFALLFNAVVFVAAVVVIYLVRGQFSGASEPSDASEWAAETASFARDVREAAGGDRPAEYDGLQRKLVPLSSRAEALLRTAPREIDDPLRRRVHELGLECRKIGMEHQRGADLLGDESLDAKLDGLDSLAREVRDQASERASERRVDGDQFDD